MQLARTSNKILNRVGSSLTKRFPEKLRIARKSEAQITRDTVRSVRGSKEANRRRFITPINENVDNGIRFAVGNPISAASQVGGKVAMGSGNIVVASIPYGGIGTGGEQLLKHLSPKYKRTTEKLQGSYSKTRLSKGLRKVRLPSLFEISQNLPPI